MSTGHGEHIIMNQVS
jgi:hypothetical protein